MILLIEAKGNFAEWSESMKSLHDKKNGQFLTRESENLKRIHFFSRIRHGVEINLSVVNVCEPNI